MRTRIAIGALTLVAVGGLLAAPRAASPAAAQAAMNHAAVVIDTGDGTVRKLCLAFPEAEISGIEALRRVDTRPNRFEAYGGKGTAVCMLCGVGCPSGACFCDPSRFWAYHRSGPGEGAYRASSVGSSATVVRDGDVEAWKWGAGESPVKVTVSEVCGVEEPPRRPASPSNTTTTTADPTPDPTTAPAEPGPALTVSPEAPRPAGSATPMVTAKTVATTPPVPTSAVEVLPTAQPGDETETAEAQVQADVVAAAGSEARGGVAPVRTDDSEDGGAASQAGAAAFVALLGGVVVWRRHLRRAKVRRVRPVR